MASVLESDAAAVERAQCEYLAWRAEAIGATVHRLPGGGVASASDRYPDHWYANRVVCASPADCEPAVRLAANVRGPHRVEIRAEWLDGFRDVWGAAGLEPAWEARVVASPLPAPSSSPPDDTVIERVRPDGADRFWASYEDCFEDPQPERRRHAQALAERPAGVRAYTVIIGDEIAGVALMYLHDRVALLADAATRPAFRRRGIHTQLAIARLADARAAGAGIVTSDVEPGGGSDRNLIRLGLDRGFMREVWRRP